MPPMSGQWRRISKDGMEIASSGVPLHRGGAERGVGCRREIADTAVRPHFVVVALPRRQDGAGVRERGEQRLVEALVAQAADEALGKRVLLRLARRDVVPFNLALLAPSQNGAAGEFGCRCR
jgi:hypothetical protein